MKKSTDWLAAIRGLPTTRRAVVHEPETPRYSHARLKLRHLINRGVYLGSLDNPERQREIEVAVWAPHQTGRTIGYYGCFRIFLDTQGNALSAILFCFYDGTEGSPGLNLADARSFAKEQGFKKVLNNE